MISLMTVPSFPVLHPLFRTDRTLVVEGAKNGAINSPYNNKVGGWDYVVNLATDCLRNRHGFSTQSITGSNCGDWGTVIDRSPAPPIVVLGSWQPRNYFPRHISDTTIVPPFLIPGQASGLILTDGIYSSSYTAWLAVSYKRRYMPCEMFSMIQWFKANRRFEEQLGSL